MRRNYVRRKHPPPSYSLFPVLLLFPLYNIDTRMANAGKKKQTKHPSPPTPPHTVIDRNTQNPGYNIKNELIGGKHRYKKRLGGSNHNILSTNEYLKKLHRYDIILFHQAQPQPNNLEIKKPQLENPNTPLRCKNIPNPPPNTQSNPTNRPTN